MTDSPFYERVYALVEQIPIGKVTTYGDLAAACGQRGAARMVGWALNAAAGTPLPCHRVVNRRGELSGARFFETPYAMEERLRAEGITFLGPGQVDIEKHKWIPPSLPSL
jgi:methylated-DNA-protein-cysteine methyltransferase-like protein